MAAELKADVLSRVLEVYEGSDADETIKLYKELAEQGPEGALAVNLMRAMKKSARAKVYRGRSHRASSYDGKSWAMGEIVKVLTDHPELVKAWGWKTDPQQAYHKWVLYVDLDCGQVSFHQEGRGLGPDYPGDWDGLRGMSEQRVINYAARVLSF